MTGLCMHESALLLIYSFERTEERRGKKESKERIDRKERKIEKGKEKRMTLEEYKEENKNTHIREREREREREIN